MRIEQLKYVVKVAETGSISAAAEQLHISQPNISKQLALLEETLKTKIFHRSKTGVRPTDIGQIIIEQAREVLLQLEKLEKMGRFESSTFVDSLAIATIPSFCMSFLPIALREFTRRYPMVQIEIIDTGSQRIKELVLDEKVDFGLLAFFESAEIEEKLIFEPLLSGRMMVCVSKNSELAEKKEISLQELIGYPIITYKEEYSMNSFVLNFLKQYGKPRLLIASGNSEASKKFIAHGNAVGFYAEIALKSDPYVMTGEIVPIPIRNPETETYFGIVHRKDVKLSVASMDFIKELRLQAKEFCSIHNFPYHQNMQIWSG